VSDTGHCSAMPFRRVQLRLVTRVERLGTADRSSCKSTGWVERHSSRAASTCRQRGQSQVDDDARVALTEAVGCHSLVDVDDKILARVIPRDARTRADVR